MFSESDKDCEKINEGDLIECQAEHSIREIGQKRCIRRGDNEWSQEDKKELAFQISWGRGLWEREQRVQRP